jgi:tetratricopeptide (TPR) repeat protein
MEERPSLRAELSIFFLMFLGLGIGWFEYGPGKAITIGWLSSSNDAANTVAAWYQNRIDGFAKLLSPLITIASGSYALYKGFYFAETRLHFRLQDYLNREEARLRAARSQLRARIERPGPTRPFETPVFLEEPMQRAVGELGWARIFWSARLPFAELNLESSIQQIERQLQLWRGHEAHYKRQLSSAHLLKGAISAARASKLRMEGRDDRDENLIALSHFLEALKLDRNDIEALEYAGHTRVQLHDYDGALEDLDQILDLTKKQPKSLARARAYRFKADVFERRGNHGLAKSALESALDATPPILGEDRIEEAQTHEAHGRICEKLGFGGLAPQSYEKAEIVYKSLGTDEAKDAVQRLRNRASGPHFAN